MLAPWSPAGPKSFLGRLGLLRTVLGFGLLAAAAVFLPTEVSPTDARAAHATEDRTLSTSEVSSSAAEVDKPAAEVPSPSGPGSSESEKSNEYAGSDESTWVAAESSGRPWSDAGAIDGLLTFRGNPTRSFYGTGPIPESPEVVWQFEIGCSLSVVSQVVKEWCGTGWTGQPVVFRPSENAVGDNNSDDDDSRWWVGFGGFDRRVNFLRADTGEQAHLPYETADIIKGSITADPDGYPLVYTGSRDDSFHIVAIDREDPVGLWRLWAYDNGPTLWNNDWDGSALVVDDFLFIGGENSRFYFVKLNRSYNEDGLVEVDPEVVASVAGWDDELLNAIGDVEVSIENSPAISGNVVYFANSGGLVQGWDITSLAEGKVPEQTFRFWVGDDTDASIVIDGEGMLYVATETQRPETNGQGRIFKLDPTKADDPVVWSVGAGPRSAGGVFGTPALYQRELVIVPTDGGQLLGLDQTTGEQRWSIDLPGPLWSSPVVVDDSLVQGDCLGGLHHFELKDSDLSDSVLAQPKLVWSLALNGCIESTPAAWDGQLFVGTRAGTFYAISE